MLRSSPAVCLVLALAGCEFWNPPDPDLNVDGVLQCGDVEVLDGYGSGDALPVDVPDGTGLELRLDLADASHSARLATSTGDSLTRALEIWDSVTGDRLVPGLQGAGETLTLELIASNQQALAGTVTVGCQASGEVCFNLGDDDGDGVADCADIACSRDPGCVAGQTNLEEVSLTCGDAIEAIPPPALSAIDDQRTVYTTHPGGEGAGPANEFWGGAEVVLTDAEATGLVTIEVGTDALLCRGSVSANVVVCDAPIRLAAGEVVDVSAAELPIWLEPVGPAFESLGLRLDCDDGS